MGIVQKYFHRLKHMPAPQQLKPKMLTISIRYMFRDGLPQGWGK